MQINSGSALRDRSSNQVVGEEGSSGMSRGQFIQGRNFLVGCGRSGTTLLQSLLASHSQIASFPESWLFAIVAGRHPARLYGWPPANLKERVKRWRDDLRFRCGFAARNAHTNVRRYLTAIGREELITHFPLKKTDLRAQLQGCIALLDSLGLEQNKPQWLEKSPLHLGYVDLIEATAPDARFIHLLRDGPEVVASLFDASRRYPEEWGGIYPTLDHCIIQWNHCIAQMRRHLHKANHILVRYERLTEDPESVLRPLCTFLHVEYEPNMLLNYSATARHMQTPEERWKEKTSGPISRAEKFYAVFDEAQRHYILERLTPLNWSELIDAGQSPTA